MADNVVLNAGSGGAVLATDDVGPGVHYQIIKIAHGALDSVTLVSTASGLPVDLRSNNLGAALDVNITASAATVTVGGTVTANAGTGTFSTQDVASLVDDAAFSPGASRVIPAGYVFDDVTPDTINEGDIGVPRMSANRNAYMTVRDAAGNERGANVDATNRLSVSVDNALAVTISALPNEGQQAMAASISVAIASDQSAVPVSGTVTANAGTGTQAVSNTVLDVVGGGTEATAQRVTLANDSTGVLSVDDNGASLTVDGTVTANAGTGTFTVGGTVTANAGTGTMAVSNTVLAEVGGGAEATAQRVTLANDSTGVLSVDDNGASLTVDGTVTANAGTGTFTVGGTVTANAGTGTLAVSNAALAVVGSGTEAAAQRVTLATDSTGVLHVDDNGGSLTIDGTVAISSLPNEGAQTAANSISVTLATDQANVPVSQATASALNAQVVGSVAHDAADSGNPVKIGGVGRTANPTAVAAGDRVDIFCDDLGKPVVYPVAPRDRIVAGARVSLTNTAETTILAAGGAGVLRDLVMLMLSNESATECRVDIRDVTAGTVMFSLDLAGDGGGAVIPFRVPWPQATANSAWTAQCSAGVSTVYVAGLWAENN